jgi:hypothetical protein
LFFADELNLNGSDNDIVEVGMIKNRVIILKPKYVVNLGRYLNSPFDPKKANCKPCWKAFNYDGKICIGLFLITCKRVKAGE